MEKGIYTDSYSILEVLMKVIWYRDSKYTLLDALQ